MVQPGPSSEPEAEQDAEVKGEAEGEAVLMEEDLIQQSLDDYDAGKYSPRLLGPNELPFDAHVLEAEEDMHRLLLLRQQLQVTGRSPDGLMAWPGTGGTCVPWGAGLEFGDAPWKRINAGAGACTQSWPGRGIHRVLKGDAARTAGVPCGCPNQLPPSPQQTTQAADKWRGYFG